jgi:hypothetical protein
MVVFGDLVVFGCLLQCRLHSVVRPHYVIDIVRAAVCVKQRQCGCRAMYNIA